MIKLGPNAKIYIDTASYTTPTWSEVTNVADATLNGDPVEIDVSSRGSVASGFKATAVVVDDPSVDFQLLCESTDPNYFLIRDAFIHKTPLFMACLDGPIATSGSWGIQGLMVITKFTRGEPLLDKITYDVTVKPALNPSLPCTWVLIP